MSVLGSAPDTCEFGMPCAAGLPSALGMPSVGNVPTTNGMGMACTGWLLAAP